MKRKEAIRVSTIMLHDKHKCAFCDDKAEAIVVARTFLSATEFPVCRKHLIDWNNNRLDV